MYVSVGIGKPPGPEGVPAKKESRHEYARMGKIIVASKRILGNGYATKLNQVCRKGKMK